VVVAAVEAATFFTLFLLFLLCFLATLVVAAGFSGVLAVFWAANAVPRTMAAPIIKAENFFIFISVSFWGLSAPSLRETFRILAFRLMRS